MNTIAKFHTIDAVVQPKENRIISNIAMDLERKKTGKKWNVVGETEGEYFFWFNALLRTFNNIVDDRNDSMIMRVLCQMLYLAIMLISIGDQ